MNSPRSAASGSAASCARAHSGESSKIMRARLAAQPFQRGSGPQAIEHFGEEAHRLDQPAGRILAERKRVVAADGDPLGTEEIEQKAERALLVDQRVDVDAPQV